MAKDIRTISDLTPDPKNANRGTERGTGMLERSLREYGAARSIVSDRNGVVLAGNKTLEQAAALGLPIEPVHTTGDRLVVVIRDDLDYGDPRAKELAIADNRVGSVNLDWDPDVLASLAEEVDLSALWMDDELAALLAGIATDADTPVDDAVPPATFGETFELVVRCTSQDDQERLYHEFSERGYACRPLTS